MLSAWHRVVNNLQRLSAQIYKAINQDHTSNKDKPFPTLEVNQGYMMLWGAMSVIMYSTLLFHHLFPLICPLLTFTPDNRLVRQRSTASCQASQASLWSRQHGVINKGCTELSWHHIKRHSSAGFSHAQKSFPLVTSTTQTHSWIYITKYFYFK